MSVVNIHIPEDLKNRLVTESNRRGLSQRALMILALEQYLEEVRRPSEPIATMGATEAEDETGDGAK